MNRLFPEIMAFYVALTIICYLVWAFNVFGGLLNYPLGNIDSLTSLFSIDVYSVVAGIGGAALIGVAALLLKPGVYAVYAMLIWGFGIAFRVVQTFVLAVPNTLLALIPAETNPNPAVFPTNPILAVITLLVGYAVFWWLLGLVIQRDV